MRKKRQRYLFQLGKESDGNRSKQGKQVIMKLCWLTDIHLNFLDANKREQFYLCLANSHVDLIMIAGDIADAKSICEILQEMVQILQTPICFVLGNHDFYHSQINTVKGRISELSKQEPLLHWLSQEKHIDCGNSTIVIGQDGWADGRYGDFNHSTVRLNDQKFIYDLRNEAMLGRNHLLRKMQELADEDAFILQQKLDDALKNNVKRIYILTHVPPFEGASWHEGNISSPDWIPFFTSKASGDVIINAATSYPKIMFEVLCGHTHSAGIYQPRNNLLVKTGKAVYGRPAIQQIFEI